MPTYRLHLAAEPTNPIPPVESLVSIEANDPVAAVEQPGREGRVPQAGVIRWARVILMLGENGRPRQVLRLPVTPTIEVPLDCDRDILY